MARTNSSGPITCKIVYLNAEDFERNYLKIIPEGTNSAMKIRWEDVYEKEAISEAEENKFFIFCNRVVSKVCKNKRYNNGRPLKVSMDVSEPTMKLMLKISKTTG